MPLSRSISTTFERSAKYRRVDSPQEAGSKGRNFSNNPISFADPTGLLTVSLFGDEYEFSLETVATGLETGLAAVGSSASMGLWDGGPYADRPGFDTSSKLADGGLLALDIASGAGAVKQLVKGAGKIAAPASWSFFFPSACAAEYSLSVSDPTLDTFLICLV